MWQHFRTQFWFDLLIFICSLDAEKGSVNIQAVMSFHSLSTINEELFIDRSFTAKQILIIMHTYLMCCNIYPLPGCYWKIGNGTHSIYDMTLQKWIYSDIFTLS